MHKPYIDLLADKAQSKVQNRENGTYDTRKFNMEFARMIVEICADIVDSAVDQREPASTYSDRILTHFGIERAEDD